ncbi:MAG: hypothetical protein ACYC3X_13180 [Pirellulaceae bacterium]
MKKATSKKPTPPANRTNTGSATTDAPPSPAGSTADANSSPPVSGSSTGPVERVPITSVTVLAIHVAWMLIGPFILLLLLVNIVRLGTGWLTTLDVTYFIVVTGMVLCRWIDQRSGQAAKSTGEPSTWADFRRYALLLPPLAIGAWILANAIGNHMF